MYSEEWAEIEGGKRQMVMMPGMGREVELTVYLAVDEWMFRRIWWLLVGGYDGEDSRWG